MDGWTHFWFFAQELMPRSVFVLLRLTSQNCLWKCWFLSIHTSKSMTYFGFPQDLATTIRGQMFMHSFQGFATFRIPGLIFILFTMFVWKCNVSRESTLEGQHTKLKSSKEGKVLHMLRRGGWISLTKGRIKDLLPSRSIPFDEAIYFTKESNLGLILTHDWTKARFVTIKVRTKFKWRAELRAHQGPNDLEHSAKTTWNTKRSQSRRWNVWLITKKKKKKHQLFGNPIPHLCIFSQNSKQKCHQLMGKRHWLKLHAFLS